MYIPKIQNCIVRQDGSKVILIVEGKSYLELPWEAAIKVADAMKAQAKKAEELAKALKIAKDQAVLIRAGAVIGLTDNPYIQKEAVNEAQHSRELRRAMPGGIKSQSIVGKPILIKKPPKGGNNAKI